MSERALCQYCGELINSRYVECLSCGTAHHHECFVENGKCTTYACGCVQFRQDGTLLNAGKNEALDIWEGLWVWQPATRTSGLSTYFLLLLMCSLLTLKIVLHMCGGSVVDLALILVPLVALAGCHCTLPTKERSVTIDFRERSIKLGYLSKSSPLYTIDFGQITLVSVSTVDSKFKINFYDSGKRLHKVRSFADCQMALRWGAYFASIVGARFVNALEEEAHLTEPRAVLTSRYHPKLNRRSAASEKEIRPDEIMYSADANSLEIVRKAISGREVFATAYQRLAWLFLNFVLIGCGSYIRSFGLIFTGCMQLLVSFLTYLDLVYSKELRNHLAIDRKELSISTETGEGFVVPKMMVDEVIVNEKQMTLTIWAAGLAYEIDWIGNRQLLWQAKAAIEHYLQVTKKEAA